jgi:RNA polymerase sigma factor (sigma-70 family)
MPAETPDDAARDLALVRAAHGGDGSARDALADRLQCIPRIVGALNARLGRRLGEHDLADVVQDTVVSVLRKLVDYAGQGVLEAWVFRFCTFEVMNALRRRHRQPAHDEAAVDAVVDTAAQGAFQRLVAREALDAAIDRVGGTEADALRMKHFEGLSFEAMAQRVRISTTAMKGRYYRALAHLERLLAADDEQEVARDHR